MQLRNTTARWGTLAQLFHWVIVALVITQFVLGLLSASLPPASLKKLTWITPHKSIGITILALAVLRLAWRWMNPTPLLPDTLKPYERGLAHFTHAALYVLLFVMPLTGWIMSSARSFPVSWFGFVQLPDLVGRNQRLYETLHTTHAILAWTLAAIAVLHVAAAFKHHLVLKDDVLKRMLPFTRTR
jgi:cytochrome b561